jgi:carbon-monoxide dehydrogenase small subunit
MNDLMSITVNVNGTQYERTVEPRLLLSDFLRHGVCGACTVLLDDEPVRSCLVFAVQTNNHRVTTVEALGTPDALHPIQEAFQERHGAQCGYCTPGFLMSLVPFLQENPDPTEEEIREAISGNLCRCTGYQHIVDAVKLAAERMRA